MPGSTESKQEFEGAFSGAELLPRPRTMGSFVMLVSILAFAAGRLRNELALTLLGTVFLAVLAWCFLGVFLSAIVYRKKGKALSMAIGCETVGVGKEGELCIKTGGGAPPGKGYFLRLPAILFRCELLLKTRDGRVIRHCAEPGFENTSGFPVAERGAYFSSPRPKEYDRFVIGDAPGFFRLSLPVRRNEGVRLLAVPGPIEELIPPSLESGGSEGRNEARWQKSDDLTDHRPYIPGDDPRRINWKLYGHAPLGELFVREGEPEPPPHSLLLILVDTEADRSLYSIGEARLAVDLLCENALAMALEYSLRGMDIQIGYTGGGITNGGITSGGITNGKNAPLDAAGLARALAFPFAIPWPPQGDGPSANLPTADLPPPEANKGRGVLVFALPRASADTSAAGASAATTSAAEASALDRFLKMRIQQNREAGQKTDIAFLYDAGSARAAALEEAAGACVSLYNGRPGIRAVKLAGRRTRGLD